MRLRMLNYVHYSLDIVHWFHRYKKLIDLNFLVYEKQLELILDIRFHEHLHESFCPYEVHLDREREVVQ